jgi:hypothetical protein
MKSEQVSVVMIQARGKELVLDLQPIKFPGSHVPVGWSPAAAAGRSCAKGVFEGAFRNS